MRLVFNYNRTTMGLNRLGQVSLLAIESDILESITNNDVINYQRQQINLKLKLF